MQLDLIDAIIFDLGGVILNLDYDLTVKAFKKLLPDFKEENFLGNINQLKFLDDYEIGKISTDDLIKSFNEYFKVSLSHEEFKSCWNEMILDFPKSRIDLLKGLRLKGKRIYLLSNINELHEVAVSERYTGLGDPSEFFSLFDKVYYSHKIGMRKPNQEIFELVIQEQKLNPGNTLFIDDSHQHVEGAKCVGLRAFHLVKGTTIEDLFN